MSTRVYKKDWDMFSTSLLQMFSFHQENNAFNSSIIDLNRIIEPILVESSLYLIKWKHAKLYYIQSDAVILCRFQVVHPAPGNATGTLVNAVLNHCSLPTVAISDKEFSSENDDLSDDDCDSCTAVPASTKGLNPQFLDSSVRPGIVHRLDKGTSGLLVVAKVTIEGSNILMLKR